MLPVICVDFDGVLASWDQGTFDEPGPPIEGAQEFVRSLSHIGRVVVHTCRTNPELYPDDTPQSLVAAIWAWLHRHGFKAVSEVYAGPGKPLAQCYIDDRAIWCSPERDHDAFEMATQLAALMVAISHPKTEGVSACLK